MKKQDLGRWAFPAAILVVGLPWYGFSARASQSDSGQQTSLAQSRNVTVMADPLADQRLSVKVTLQKQDVDISNELESLGSLGHIKLTYLLQPGRVSFSYHNVPLRDILDSFAHTYDGAWRRGPAGSLILGLPDDPHDLDPFRPHTQAEADEDQAGHPLPGELQQLSPDTLQALEKGQNLDDLFGPQPGLPFNDLPPALQGTLRQMQQAELRVLAERGDTLALNTVQNSDITNARVVLNLNDNGRYTQYDVSFFNPPMTVGDLIYSGTSAGVVSTTVFKDPSDQNQGFVPVSAITPPLPLGTGDAEADAVSRTAALKTDPALKRRVSLTTNLASMSDSLEALSAKMGIAFVAPDQDGLRSVSYKGVPLSDVLDGLAARYTTDVFQCTWGVRPSGIIVFHFELTPQEHEMLQMRAMAAAEEYSQTKIAEAGGINNGGQ